MSKRVSKQPEDHKKDVGQGTKRLRKREHRLLKRLEEAQERYESALARLQRAEARLQKRQERVERLEGRLSLLQQQMLPYTIVLSESELSPDVEIVEITLVELEPSEAKPDVPASEEVLLAEEESEQEDSIAQDNSTTPFADTENIDQLEPEQVEEEPVADLLEPEQEAEVFSEHEMMLLIQNFATQFSTDEKQIQVVTPEAATQPFVATQEEAEIQHTPELVSHDIRSALIHEARTASATAEQAANTAVIRANHILEHLEQMFDSRFLLQELAQLQSETTILSSLARDARRITEALLSQEINPEMITVLAQEVEQQQQALALIRMSIDLSQNGDTLAAPPADDVTAEREYGSLAGSDEDELNLYEEEIAFDLPTTLFHQPLAGQEPPKEVSDLAGGQTPLFSLTAIAKATGAEKSAAGLTQGESETTSSAPADVAQVSHLDEDEKEVETVAAMLVADVAAAAAAEAEALAEASSLQTRNAAVAAAQADLVLEQIRVAIQRGVLSDSEARSALQLAERSATEAHAALADAEAAEAQAISTAINAEASAEVAEGMALSVHDRAEKQESTFSESSLRSQPSEQTDEYLVVNDAELNLAINRLAADEEEIRARTSSYQELA